jgi:hypothetical protein
VVPTDTLPTVSTPKSWRPDDDAMLNGIIPAPALMLNIADGDVEPIPT